MPDSNHRQPRAIVIVNGVRVPWYDIDTNSNSFYQADSFKVIIPLAFQRSDMSRSWWAGQSILDVDIYIGTPSDPNKYSTEDLPLIISGRADEMSYDVVTDTITLSGRDYTAEFIDTKTTMKWPNRTASDIVRSLAVSHGLTPKVVATRGKVGEHYQIDHTKMTSQSSEWDLMTWLAHQEGYRIYVVGKEVHFEPISDDAPTYVMEYKGSVGTDKWFNGERLVIDRNLTLARDIIVHVYSWDYKHKKGYTKTAKATHSKDKVLKSTRANIGQPQVYSYVIPNLSPEKALKEAQRKLAEISHHQLKLVATGIPGDSALTPRHRIMLVGTGAYDQAYYVDSIIRRMSIQDGYRMDIVAKNHDTNSVVVV